MIKPKPRPRPNFEVEVKIQPSCGGGFQRILVAAEDQSAAIIQASVNLDRAGIDHWSLIRVVSLLN